MAGGTLSAFTVRSVATGLMSAALMVSMSVAQESGVFDGSNADIFVIDPFTGQSVGLNANQWVEDYNNGTPVPLSAKQQALINQLPRSSTPMSGGQPSISIADLGSVDRSISDGAEADDLLLTPQSGSFSQTLEVQAGVSADLLDQGDITVMVTVNGLTVANFSLCQTGTASNGCRKAQALQNGYFGVRRYLADDGSYQVVFKASDANGSLGELNTSYQIASADPEGRKRDTDGDGIPDLIEIAAGMNPLADVAESDFDADGWTDLDEWLRDSDGEGADAVPLDTDGDGWSDFDERLRGTRADDPQPTLLADESLDSKAVRDNLQRFKEFPNASRLYEVEIIPQSDLMSTSLDGKWVNVEAFSLDGEALWLFSEQVTEDELSERFANADSVAVSVKRTSAQTRLEQSKLPAIRLAAGLPVVINAHLRGESATRVQKQVLPAYDDVNLADFAETNPEWDSVEQWKQALIAWLSKQVVQPMVMVIDDESTRTVAGLEQLLTDEASANQAATPVLYGRHSPTVKIPWLSDFLNAVQARVNNGFAGLVQQLQAGLSARNYAEATGAFIDEALSTTPLNQFSDIWTSTQFNQRVLLPGCFIFASDLDQLEQNPEAKAQFEQNCPEFHTEDDLAQANNESVQRRYLLRSLLFGDSLALAAGDASTAAADTDGDGLENRREAFASPYALSTNLLLADTDDDGSNDFDDVCPLDAGNRCNGDDFAAPPQLLLGDLAPVRESEGGSLALVALHLSAVALNDVEVRYRAVRLDDDTAEAGSDFVMIEGVVQIVAGEQLAIVAIPILDDESDEDAEQFSLEITAITGAVSAIPDDRIAITIDNRDTRQDLPPTAVASVANAANERALVVLDGSNSSDDSGALRYAWTQLDGPSVVLRDADQVLAQFDAPETLDPVTITLQLQVTDDGEQADTDTAVITINPVDDPPEVLAALEVDIALGETRLIPTNSVLANMREPDGEAMQLVAVIGQPSGAAARVDDAGLTVRANSGEKQISGDMGGFTRSALSSDQFLFVETGNDFSDPQRLFLYDQQDDVSTLIHTTAGGGSVDTIVPAATQSLFYFSGFSGGVRQFSESDGVREITALDRLPFFGAALQESTGDLYFCDDSFLTWTSVDAQTLAVRSSTSCESSGVEFNAEFSDRICLNSFQDLFCSTASGDMELVHRFNGQLAGLIARGDELLAIVNNTDTANYEAIVFDSAFNVTPLGDFSSAAIQTTTAFVAGGGVILGVQHVDNTVQLFGWGGAASGAPVALTARFSPNENRFDFPPLVSDGNTVYWLVAIDGSGSFDLHEFVIESTSGSPALGSSRVLAQIQPSGGNRVGNVLPRREGVALPLTDPAASDFTCQIVRFDRSSGTRSQLLARTSCGPLIDVNGVMVYSKPDATQDFNLFFRRDGDAFSGDTSFAIEVQDEGGNATNLPVNLRDTTP